MKKDIKIKTPMLPNFLFSEDKNIQFSISEFTEKQLRQIGKDWTEALVNKLKDKKNK